MGTLGDKRLIEQQFCLEDSFYTREKSLNWFSIFY